VRWYDAALGPAIGVFLALVCVAAVLWRLSSLQPSGVSPDTSLSPEQRTELRVWMGRLDGFLSRSCLLTLSTGAQTVRDSLDHPDTFITKYSAFLTEVNGCYSFSGKNIAPIPTSLAGFSGVTDILNAVALCNSSLARSTTTAQSVVDQGVALDSVLIDLKMSFATTATGCKSATDTYDKMNKAAS